MHEAGALGSPKTDGGKKDRARARERERKRKPEGGEMCGMVL